jgi:hypothetical protein
MLLNVSHVPADREHSNVTWPKRSVYAYCQLSYQNAGINRCDKEKLK